jgi:hypothetical protein
MSEKTLSLAANRRKAVSRRAMRSVVSDSRRDNQCQKRCQWVEHCKSGEPMDNKKDSNDEATVTVYDNVRAALTLRAPEFSNFQ